MTSPLPPVIDPLRSDALGQTSRLVRSVYREVWQEFYRWDAAYARSRLDSFAIRHIPDDALAVSTFIADRRDPLLDGEHKFNDAVAVCPPTDDSYTVYDFCQDSDRTTSQWSVIANTQQVDAFVSCEAFEACAPLSCNVFHGDDPEDMTFVPFADDPAFNVQDHLEEYKTFSWQSVHEDSDLNTILMETARRLWDKYGVTIEHVDETGVLPRPLKTYLGVSGAISASLQRDSLNWPGSSHSSVSMLPDILPSQRDDLRARLHDHLNLFCPNLNCIQASCFTHNADPVKLDLQSGQFRHVPSRPRGRPRKQTHESCGSDCESTHVSVTAEDVSWPVADTEVLRVTLHVLPTATSCELAAICRRPCFEVAAMRNVVGVAPLEDQRNGKARVSALQLKFADHSSSKFTPNDPCVHEGPCTKATRCACFLNKAHCTRNCCCDKRCQRRWKGCACNKKGCLPSYCPCRSSNRECDPELCASCTRSRASCRNSQLQRGCQKGLEVKKGKHGLGVFLKEAAEEGDLIAEYVGELIYEPTFDSRGQLSEHRGRSYVYGLNASLNIDSTYAGNEARFINHAPANTANCQVGIFLVNGDHRIGIYAKRTLVTGTELFLDYGPEFPIK